jgi:hypothetical protein
MADGQKHVKQIYTMKLTVKISIHVTMGTWVSKVMRGFVEEFLSLTMLNMLNESQFYLYLYEEHKMNVSVFYRTTTALIKHTHTVLRALSML